MTNKEAIEQLLIIKDSLMNCGGCDGARQSLTCIDLAIKALHIVEIIDEELSPADEDKAIWFDIPYFEEIQERAEKRADKREKDDD